jgi:hypothetical protein
MRFRLMVAALLGTAAMLHVASAGAQLNNQAYSPGGGYGMSTAARQALFNQQLTGATPGDVIRGPNGTLLNVTRDENGLAVVTTQGGAVIPQYRGRNHALGGVYVDDDGYIYGMDGAHDTVSTWTSQVNALGGRHN